MLKVRATAQVGETSVGIECNGAVLQVPDKLDLVRVAFLGEVLEGLGLGDLFAFEGLFGAGEFYHLVFDGLEVGLADGAVAKVNVVIKSGFHGRAHAEADAGIKGLEGLGHKVCGRVPEYVFGLFVFPGTDGTVGKS